MTELKAYIAPTPDGTGLADYYLKSEADKVIADLEQKLAAAQQVLRLNKPEALYSNLEIIGRLNHKIDVVERRERHQKYKRCLAMAKYSAAECVVNQNIYKRFMTRKSEFRIGHFRKWYNRWIAIAEKFKEAK